MTASQFSKIGQMGLATPDILLMRMMLRNQQPPQIQTAPVENAGQGFAQGVGNIVNAVMHMRYQAMENAQMDHMLRAMGEQQASQAQAAQSARLNGYITSGLAKNLDEAQAIDSLPEAAQKSLFEGKRAITEKEYDNNVNEVKARRFGQDYLGALGVNPYAAYIAMNPEADKDGITKALLKNNPNLDVRELDAAYDLNPQDPAAGQALLGRMLALKDIYKDNPGMAQEFGGALQKEVLNNRVKGLFIPSPQTGLMGIDTPQGMNEYQLLTGNKPINSYDMQSQSDNAAQGAIKTFLDTKSLPSDIADRTLHPYLTASQIGDNKASQDLKENQASVVVPEAQARINLMGSTTDDNRFGLANKGAALNLLGKYAGTNTVPTPMDSLIMSALYPGLNTGGYYSQMGALSGGTTKKPATWQALTQTNQNMNPPAMPAQPQQSPASVARQAPSTVYNGLTPSGPTLSQQQVYANMLQNQQQSQQQQANAAALSNYAQGAWGDKSNIWSNPQTAQTALQNALNLRRMQGMPAIPLSVGSMNIGGTPYYRLELPQQTLVNK